jgi:hypothetical protein
LGHHIVVNRIGHWFARRGFGAAPPPAPLEPASAPDEPASLLNADSSSPFGTVQAANRPAFKIAPKSGRLEATFILELGLII